MLALLLCVGSAPVPVGAVPVSRGVVLLAMGVLTRAHDGVLANLLIFMVSFRLTAPCRVIKDTRILETNCINTAYYIQ